MDQKTPKRTTNFNAGPAGLPLEVLQKAQAEMLDWNGSGLSVMEMSHRSKQFISIADHCKEMIRQLLKVPDNYHILFMQGGGTGQFAAVPLNLLGDKTEAMYLLSGGWSEKAAEEARKYCKVNVVGDSGPHYTVVPDPATWDLSRKSESAYFYFCANETVHGNQCVDIPDMKQLQGMDLVGDYSSCFMSAPIDVSRFAVIFAGAQKNIGMAGLTVVIVRNDVLDRVNPMCPVVFNYKETAAKDSMYNTPPCYNIYITGLVMDWMKAQGGVEGMAALATAKSNLLYDFVDQSNFYSCPVESSHRSLMNVRFQINGAHGAKLEKEFVKEAAEQGLIGLEGHRMIGGLRASLYNSVTLEDTKALVKFMEQFAQRHV